MRTSIFTEALALGDCYFKFKNNWLLREIEAIRSVHQTGIPMASMAFKK